VKICLSAQHVGTGQRCMLVGVWQLRLVTKKTRALLSEAAKTVIHVFTSSRLDYCNYVLFAVLLSRT